MSLNEINQEEGEGVGEAGVGVGGGGMECKRNVWDENGPFA